MKKFSSILIVFILLILVTPKNTLASPRQEILGDTSNKSLFPAVTSGTGFLLPDSPFYALDKIFQSFKIASAVTPQAKANVEIQIIGERLAELRLMHAKGNLQAIATTLLEIEKEGKNAAQYVKDAAATGDDVTVLAKQVNDQLRNYRTVLVTAANGASEELSLKIQSSNHSLLVSKVNIEEYLNVADQEEAISNDLENEVETVVLGISDDATNAEKKIENLEKRAAKAEELQAKKEEQQEKIEAKKLQAKQLAEKRKELIEKRKKLLEERKKKFEAAREALKKAKEAKQNFLEAKKAGQELKKQDSSENEQEDEDDDVITATPTPTTAE